VSDVRREVSRIMLDSRCERSELQQKAKGKRQNIIEFSHARFCSPFCLQAEIILMTFFDCSRVIMTCIGQSYGFEILNHSSKVWMVSCCVHAFFQ
jgi:hypothetical protein